MKIKIGLAAVFFILILITIASVLAVSRTFTVQETGLVRLRTNTQDIDNDIINITYSLPLNQSGEWQTGYDDAGFYNIKITASDGQASTTETVTLIVEERNRPPEITYPAVTVKEGKLIQLNLPAEDADGDTLTYHYPEPFGENGFWQTGAQDAGNYQLAVEVSDGELTSKVNIDVTALEVDQPLDFNVPAQLDVYENEHYEWNLEIIEPDGDDISINLLNLPEGAVFDREQNILTWRPSFDAVKRKGGTFSTFLNALRLENKFLREEKLPPLIVEACSTECMTTEIPIIIHNVNRKPLVQAPANIVLQEGENIKVKANASDPDGDIVHYTFSAPLDVWDGSWTPRAGERGEYIASITASDGEMEETIPLTITVLPQNQQPQLKIKNDEIIINEGEFLQFSVTAFDPDGDNVTLSVDDLPAGASFDNGIFTWTPSPTTVTNKSGRWEDNLISSIALANKFLSSESITTWIEFTASDDEFKVVHPVQITVKNVNQKPQLVDFLPPSAITARVNQPVIFHIAATDLDNDLLSYKWSFTLHEPSVKGTDTIERTFVTPGKKKVRVNVNDGRQEFVKEWDIDVLEEKKTAPLFNDSNFKVYVIEG